MLFHYAECYCAECRVLCIIFAECHYAECRYDECHYAECHGTSVLVTSVIYTYSKLE